MTTRQYSEPISIHNIASRVSGLAIDEDVLAYDSPLFVTATEMDPIKIDALLIVLCKSGSARIGIDLREYDVAEDSLMVIQPRNYLYIKSRSDDFVCSVVACSHHVVEDVLPKLTEILPLLMHHRIEPVRNLTEEEARGIRLFYEFLCKILSAGETPFRRQKVLCLLQAALYEMIDINMSHASPIETPRSRKEEIMARFILSVGENFRNERQVAYYAQKLCITPKHLSAVVKEISGRTAGEWIDHYVVMEAKILLKTTDMTIQEIAVALNFANQSFFGKYFKHQTKLSPTAFRKQFVR